MKVYLLEQNTTEGWDTYDSVVVIAEDVEDARNIHPSSFVTHIRGGTWRGTNISGEEYSTGEDTWAKYEDIDSIEATYIGETDKERGVILASFNAG